MAEDTMQVAARELGLYLNRFDSGVLNITTLDGREMTRADVDAFRVLLADSGLAEAESWVATQGASWLSDGLFAGVSFKTQEVGSDA